MQRNRSCLKFACLLLAPFVFSSCAESSGRTVEVYDYKPHYACSDEGRANAIGWVEQVLRAGSTDFFAISQLEKQTICPTTFDPSEPSAIMPAPKGGRM